MIKTNTLLLTVLLLLLLLCGCQYCREVIELDGFSPELKETIRREYGLTIPDSAVFDHGQMIFPLRNSSLQMVFRVPENDLAKCMDAEWQAGLVTDEQQKKLTAAEQSVQQATTTAPSSSTTTAASELSASGSSQMQDTTQATQAAATSSADPITTSLQTESGNIEPGNAEPAPSSYRWLLWCIPLALLLAAGVVGIVLLKKGKGSPS